MSWEFNWNSPGLSTNEFHALANLPALRNSGQVERASWPDTTLQEDDEDDDRDSASIDTSTPHQLADSGQD